jgi:thiamine-phosphate pyrophosphorylase
MMNNDPAGYTPAAFRALEASRHFARRSKAALVQPLHLLQGLLEEEEGLAAQLLATANVKVSILRHNLGCSLPSTSQTELIDVPFNPAAEAILDQARFLTKEVGGEPLVAGTMLLLSLIRREPSLKQFLETHGLDTARLEREYHATQGPPLTLDEELSLEPARDQIDMARVLDANFNRAREAIRVVEDYCRFVLDDKFLSNELKQMRHNLAEVVEALPANMLIESRDTQRDVGTLLSTDRESQRTSPLDVAKTNLSACKKLSVVWRNSPRYRARTWGESWRRFVIVPTPWSARSC